MEFRGDLWHHKTSLPELSCGIVYVILCLAVLVEHRLMTDRHRRTQGNSIYRASIASRGKKPDLVRYSIILEVIMKCLRPK